MILSELVQTHCQTLLTSLLEKQRLRGLLSPGAQVIEKATILTQRIKHVKAIDSPYFELALEQTIAFSETDIMTIDLLHRADIGDVLEADTYELTDIHTGAYEFREHEFISWLERGAYYDGVMDIWGDVEAWNEEKELVVIEDILDRATTLLPDLESVRLTGVNAGVFRFVSGVEIPVPDLVSMQAEFKTKEAAAT